MAKKKDEELEEKKEMEEDQDDEESSFGLMKIIKVLVGLVLIVGGIGSYWYWYGELLLVVKGCLGAAVALIGLVVVMMGWSD